jgi:PTS system N-acetylglucosamine-specific IIC component
MYHCALPARRRAVGGLLASMALTAALTGVTEPIEFTFLFLAPGLYAVHAVLTGVSMVLMDALRVRLGFSFSAGLLDYVLSYRHATRPLLLLPVGLIYAAAYYGLFRFAILRFDLATPGRGPEEAAPGAETVVAASGANPALAYIQALGGAGNLVSVDACTTRLRLTVVGQDQVQAATLRQLGARGLVRPGGNALQVVIGPAADQLAGQIRAALRTHAAPAITSLPASPATVVPASLAPPPRTSGPTALPAAPISGLALLAALGGARNVRAVQAAGSRLRIEVEDAVRIERSALRLLGARGLAFPAAGCVHVILGPAASAAASELQQLLSL